MIRNRIRISSSALFGMLLVAGLGTACGMEDAPASAVAETQAANEANDAADGGAPAEVEVTRRRPPVRNGGAKDASSATPVPAPSPPPPPACQPGTSGCGAAPTPSNDANGQSSIGVNSTWVWMADGNYFGTNRTANGIADGSAFNPMYIEKVSKMRSIRFMDLLNTNSSKVTSWDSRTKVTENWNGGAADGGAPLEVVIGLCNRARVDCWINIPIEATDDYIRNLAQLVRATLSPSLIVRIELGNENWNGGFHTAQYALAEGQRRWKTGDWVAHEWSGMRLAQACDIFKKDVFGAEKGRVRCVAATQAGNTGVANGFLTCPRWVAEGNEPCWKHGFDELATTWYFNGGYQSGRLDGFMNQGSAGVDRAIDAIAASVPGEIQEQTAPNEQFLTRYGLTLVGYEGGLDLGWNSSGSRKDFYRAISRHPRIADVYKTALEKWRQYSGTIAHQYVDIRAPNEGAFYGALESVTDSTPRWDALVSYSTSVRCWWAGCQRP